MDSMTTDYGRPFADMGGSLPVPNVQALAAAAPEQIPQRYLRSEIQQELIVDRDVSWGIPVIDLSLLLDPLHSRDEMIKFESACANWGFFQLINHGVSDEVIQQMKSDLEEFFKLPLKEKQSVAQLPNSLEGYGQAFVLSEEQKLDWGDMLYLATQPTSSRNMRLWPMQPPTFRKSLDNYSSELQRVSNCLLGLIAKNLGIEQELLLDFFSEGRQAIRMNIYPACPQANRVLGLSPHSDAVGLTLLLHANEVQGLQFKKDGKWIPVEPLPGAFTVNIGDMLQIITNGKYKSIEHRAIVNTEEARLSIVAFHTPNPDAEIGPLGEIVKEGRNCYRTLRTREIMKLIVTGELGGRSLLDTMKLDH